MNYTENDTKKRILRNAGVLFSRNGRNGVGIRKIAEKSGVSVNTVMYHFTNKDNLYAEAVVDRITNDIPYAAIFAPLNAPEPCSRAEVPDRIARVIRNLFDEFLKEGMVEQGDFLVQALFSKDPRIAGPVMNAFSQFDLPLMAFFDRAGIAYDKPTIMFLAYVLWSQMIFAISAGDMVKADLGVAEVPVDYYYDIARRITEVYCQQLKLSAHDERIWQIVK